MSNNTEIVNYILRGTISLNESSAVAVLDDPKLLRYGPNDGDVYLHGKCSFAVEGITCDCLSKYLSIGEKLSLSLCVIVQQKVFWRCVGIDGLESHLSERPFDCRSVKKLMIPGKEPFTLVMLRKYHGEPLRFRVSIHGLLSRPVF